MKKKRFFLKIIPHLLWQMLLGSFVLDCDKDSVLIRKIDSKKQLMRALGEPFLWDVFGRIQYIIAKVRKENISADWNDPEDIKLLLRKEMLRQIWAKDGVPFIEGTDDAIWREFEEYFPHYQKALEDHLGKLQGSFGTNRE